MKTIKELEKSIGVSKVSLYSMLKKPEFKGHVFKGEKNVKLIDDIGEQLLKTHYLREQDETIKDIVIDVLSHEEENTTTNKDSSKVDEEVKNPEIIRILQEQLQTKDEQINNLLSIVLNQQKLQGAQLLTDNQNARNDNREELEPEAKGFWSKLFKK